MNGGFDMSSFDHPSMQRAQRYCAKRNLRIIDQPGYSGNDGSVHATDRFTVVKAFDRPRTFMQEAEAYRRLRLYNVVHVQGHHVPQLLHEDAALGVLELSVVRRPFVLDFGKIRLDQRLEEYWPEDVLAERWAYWESLFEPDHWPTVLAIFGELGRRYGIWLEDLHPGNIAFDKQASD